MDRFAGAGGFGGDRYDDLSVAGEFHRVGEQVSDDLTQPGHVAADDGGT